MNYLKFSLMLLQEIGHDKTYIFFKFQHKPHLKYSATKTYIFKLKHKNYINNIYSDERKRCF